MVDRFSFSNGWRLLGRLISAEMLTEISCVGCVLSSLSESCVFAENPSDTMVEEITVMLGMNAFDGVDPLRICYFTDV